MKQITDVLREDHRCLRRILSKLEALLINGCVPKEALKLVLSHLELELETHIRREAYLSPFLMSVTRGELPGYHEAREHEDIRTSLQLLKDLVEKDYFLSLGAIEAYAFHLIDTLKEHMMDEETHLFPLAERVMTKALLEDINALVEERHLVA